MNISERNLTLCCYWYDRPMTGGQFLAASKTFIQRLLGSFPELCNVRVVKDRKALRGTISDDFSNFEEEVISALPKDWAFINADPKNKNFTRESTAAICFRTSCLIAEKSSNSDVLFVQINAGRADGRSSDQVIIDIAPEFESPEFIRKLLGMCVEFWNPHHAVVDRAVIRSELKQAIGDVRIGWLTYLTNPNAPKLLSKDVPIEHFHSGILIQATAQPIAERDAESIMRLRGIIDKLQPSGILQNPKKVPQIMSVPRSVN